MTHFMCRFGQCHGQSLRSFEFGGDQFRVGKKKHTFQLSMFLLMVLVIALVAVSPAWLSFCMSLLLVTRSIFNEWCSELRMTFSQKDNISLKNKNWFINQYKPYSKPLRSDVVDWNMAIKSCRQRWRLSCALLEMLGARIATGQSLVDWCLA